MVFTEIQEQNRIGYLRNSKVCNLLTECYQTPLPSLESSYQSPGELGQAQVEPSIPCSLLAQGQPQPPQEQLGALPSQPQGVSSACQAHGWSDHHLQVGQANP